MSFMTSVGLFSTAWRRESFSLALEYGCFCNAVILVIPYVVESFEKIHSFSCCLIAYEFLFFHKMLLLFSKTFYDCKLLISHNQDVMSIITHSICCHLYKVPRLGDLFSLHAIIVLSFNAPCVMHPDVMH